MKADESTLRFSDTSLIESIIGGGTDRQQPRPIQMMMRMNNRGGRAAKIPMDELPRSTVASASLRIDWKLPEQVDLDMIALLKNRLERELDARKLTEIDSKMELSNEEKEAVELFESQLEEYSYGESPAANQEPRILLVAIIPDEIRQKVTKQAALQARLNAERLAASGGFQFGKLIGVQPSLDPIDSMQMSRLYSPFQYNEFQSVPPDVAFQSPAPNEVIAMRTSDLQLQTTITFTYEIK